MTDTALLPDTSMVLLPIALAALAVLAAGCVGSDEPSPRIETPTETASTVDVPSRPATFPVDAVNRTTWANGSFSPAEIAAGQADRGQRTHRVSLDDLPTDVPVRIVAELTYTAPTASATDVDHADVFVDRQLEPDAGYPLYQADREERDTSERLEATLVPDGSTTPEVVVLGDRPPADTELSYTLRVDLHVSPHAVPAEAATAVEVPADSERIEILPVDPGGKVTVRAWAPDDDYLGTVEGSDETLSVSTPEPGSYIVLANASSAVRLVNEEDQTLDANGALQAVGWAEETGEPQTVQASGVQTWSTDLTRAPLTAGFTLRAQNGDVVVIADTSIDMEGPGGNLLAVDCTRCFWTVTAPMRTSFDDPKLTPGTYEITIDSTANADLEIVPRWVHYER